MKLFYIQNRGCCGNSMLWWRKGGGYTTHVNEAETFTEEDVRKCSNRSIDVIWPKDYIDGVTSHHVDIQDTNCAIGRKASEL